MRATLQRYLEQAMSATLEEIFEQCGWRAKHRDAIPDNPDTIRYKWTEEESGNASIFLARGIIKEETPAVRRALYLGRDNRGRSIWRNS